MLENEEKQNSRLFFKVVRKSGEKKQSGQKDWENADDLATAYQQRNDKMLDVLRYQLSASQLWMVEHK